MDILIAFWSLFGWKWFLVLPALYGAMLIGANSPQTFKRSRKGLERIANETAAKAHELAQRGK